MKIYHRTIVSSPLSVIKNKFDQDLFLLLKPPFLTLKILRFDGCKKNDEVHLEISFGFIKHLWISLITEEHFSGGVWYFIDESFNLPYPLTYWRHKHQVTEYENGQCEISDEIEYKTKNIIFDIIHLPIFYCIFYFRKPVYQKFFRQK